MITLIVFFLERDAVVLLRGLCRTSLKVRRTTPGYAPCFLQRYVNGMGRNIFRENVRGWPRKSTFVDTLIHNVYRSWMFNQFRRSSPAMIRVASGTIENML